MICYFSVYSMFLRQTRNIYSDSVRKTFLSERISEARYTIFGCVHLECARFWGYYHYYKSNIRRVQGEIHGRTVLGGVHHVSA